MVLLCQHYFSLWMRSTSFMVVRFRFLISCLSTSTNLRRCFISFFLGLENIIALLSIFLGGAILVLKISASLIWSWAKCKIIRIVSYHLSMPSKEVAKLPNYLKSSFKVSGLLGFSEGEISFPESRGHATDFSFSFQSSWDDSSSKTCEWKGTIWVLLAGVNWLSYLDFLGSTLGAIFWVLLTVGSFWILSKLMISFSSLSLSDLGIFWFILSKLSSPLELLLKVFFFLTISLEDENHHSSLDKKEFWLLFGGLIVSLVGLLLSMFPSTCSCILILSLLSE